ncbi:MAG: ATP phosphoribosyltransferase regulatory subunit [bacterium]|nr:ATP phosphoribosyltransferase regulatory subunit [bacterium]
MNVQLLHTPEGVRDIYGRECARKQKVEQQILSVFHRYGYQSIETPTFEFFDIFSKDRGSVASREMFKFFDRENNTLVLRPDMTPAIARCVAKYHMEETMPLHLCYAGQTFTNSSNYQGRLKESTQMGAECILDASADADAQMLAMVAEALQAAGLSDFQLEIGEVEFFRGLAEEAGMGRETAEALRELIEQKNYFAVEEMLSGLSLTDSLRELFLKLPELFGNAETIAYAREHTKNPRALAALARLEEVLDILDLYGLTEFVSVDLGMLSKYQYYTGIIFKAFTYGTGDYIVNGGRYDKLLEQFGKEAPAVGFTILVDSLLLALERQKQSVTLETMENLILYQKSSRKAAFAFTKKLREEGHSAISLLVDNGKDFSFYEEYARRMGMEAIYYLDSDGEAAVKMPYTKEEA